MCDIMVFVEKLLHVYPLDDLKEHCCDGDGVCDCMPRYEVVDGTTLVIHNAWDGREYLEENKSKNTLVL